MWYLNRASSTAYASITASVRPLNWQTAVDNSLVPRPSTPEWDRYQISWVCSLSNPRLLIHLLIRLHSCEINDQASSLIKIHWRGWSLGTRLVWYSNTKLNTITLKPDPSLTMLCIYCNSSVLEQVKCKTHVVNGSTWKIYYQLYDTISIHVHVMIQYCRPVFFIWILSFVNWHVRKLNPDEFFLRCNVCAHTVLYEN